MFQFSITSLLLQTLLHEIASNSTLFKCQLVKRVFQSLDMGDCQETGWIFGRIHTFRVRHDTLRALFENSLECGVNGLLRNHVS